MPPRKAAPPKKAPAAAKKKKTASGYRMPEHLAEGTVLNDLMKKQWTLGKSIGIGGFGEIYLAAEGNSKADGDKAKYVVKIEPKENGPLFVEMHFYIQVGTADHVKKWGRPVNIPLLRGQGSYNHKDDVYRFLVIDRLGVDLDKTFQNGKHPLPDSLIGTLAVQIISSLEYIHSRGYTHNDVKAANLLCGIGKDSGMIYLVDFGLCVKYIKPDGHKEYKADPRKAHDGTIEYLSRDAHIGCTSRRSDLENLCYNLYHWKTGTLPWISKLTNAVTVQGEKTKFMSGLPGTVATLPRSIQNLFNYVAALDFQEEPDYEKCRGFFKAEVKETGGKVNLSPAALKSKSAVSPVKRKSAVSPTKPAKTKPAAVGRGRKKPVPVVNSSEEESQEDDIKDTDSDEDMFSPSPQKSKGTPKLRGTPRGTPRARGTPRGTPRRGTPRGTPTANSEVVKVTKYKEAGCQTSPGFVAKVRAERKAGVAGESSSSSPPKKPAPKPKAAAKPKPAADSPRRKPAAKQQPEKSEDDGNFGFANPTPAMLEILKRKKAVEEEKAAKKRKR